MRRTPAPWAPPEPEADRIIARHAPRLARDLRLSMPEESESVRTGRLVSSLLAGVGVRADVAAWNMQRAFGAGVTYGPILDEPESLP